MLEILKSFTLDDLIKIYEELRASKMVYPCSVEGLAAIYEELADIAAAREADGDEPIDESYIRDFLRFDIEILSTEQIAEEYQLEADEVEQYLNDNSYIISKYIEGGKMYYIFYNIWGGKLSASLNKRR